MHFSSVLSLSLCVCVGTTHEMLCTCSTRACTEVGASQLAEVCRIHSNLVPASWRLHDEIPAYLSTEMLRSSSRRRLKHYSRKSAGFHHLQAGTRELCISHTCTETHMCVCLLMFIRTYMHVRSKFLGFQSQSRNQFLHSIFCKRYAWYMERVTLNMVLQLKLCFLSWMLVLVVSALLLSALHACVGHLWSA